MAHYNVGRAFKVAALERMAAGENVSALSRELGIRRKLLYQWRDAVRRGAIAALRGRGRPRAGKARTRPAQGDRARAGGGKTCFGCVAADTPVWRLWRSSTART